MTERNLTYHLFALVRVLLYPLALLYGAIVWVRGHLYDSGLFSSIRFSIPVICVGNLSVGGTGKTPHVEYLIRLLQYQFRVATMSRGYKRRSQGFILADPNANALRIGDEPMQYLLKFPDLVVSVAEERMTGIPTLLQKEPQVDVVLLDDAYQHRSVRAGLNILITDYAKPFYEDYVLPYGSLREGRRAAARADIIIVSKCPPDLQASNAELVIRRIGAEGHQQVYFTTIQYGVPFDLLTGAVVHVEGAHVVLASGIAKPEPLIAHLKVHAADVHVLTYPDHHYFLMKELDEMEAAVRNWQRERTIMVTTEKDATRLLLHRDRLGQFPCPIVVLPIYVSFLFEQSAAFDQRVIHYVDETLGEYRKDFGIL